jgi:hypothetical protein
MDNGSQTGEKISGVISNGYDVVAGVKVNDSSFASTASLLSSRPSFLTKGLDLLMKQLISLIAIPFLCYISITKFNILKDIFDKATSELPIQNSTEYKDSGLIKRLQQTLSGKVFENAVEHQIKEGYCCHATQRCLLKSIPKFDSTNLAEQTRGPATIEQFAETLDKMSGGVTKSKVIWGCDGFDAFLSALKRVNDPNVRVALNFLRSPLFGVKKPLFLPFHWFLCFFGGHFSPVIGFFEDLNLVAVFDVNSNYGLFFVSPQRLYQAVNTHDVTSGKNRGIVVVEVLE